MTNQEEKVKYHIAIFPKDDDDDDVDIIADSWVITAETCWWPNYKSDKVKRACKQNEAPKPGWEVSRMRILKSYDSYKLARENLLRAEYGSDLNSDTESTPKGRRATCEKRRLNLEAPGTGNSKLHIVPFSQPAPEKVPRFELVGSGSPLKMPPPPPAARKPAKKGGITVKKTPSGYTSGEDEGITMPDPFSLNEINDLLEDDIEVGVGLGVASKGTEQVTTTSLSAMTHAIDIHPRSPAELHVRQSITPTFDAITGPRGTCSAGTGIEHNGFQSAFEDWTVRNIENIKLRLKQLQDSVDLLVRFLTRENQTSASVPDIEIPLPMGSLEHLNSLAEKICDRTIRDALVNRLSQTGGKKVRDCTRRVMAKLLTDEFAQSFSWLGSRGAKSSFANTVMKDVVFESVRKTPLAEQFSDADIEATIKDWLKNAKKRLDAKKQPAPPANLPIEEEGGDD